MRYQSVLLLLLIVVASCTSNQHSDTIKIIKNPEFSLFEFSSDSFYVVPIFNDGFKRMNTRQALDISDAVFVIQGGFFSLNGKPIGIIKKNNIDYTELKTKKFDGFYIGAKQRVFFGDRKLFSLLSKKAEDAIQSHSCLMLNGKITYKKRADTTDAFANELTRRAAFGKTSRQNPTFIICSYCTVYQLAQICKENMLTDAILLDGGSSTQYSLQYNDTEITYFPSFTKSVPVFLGVVPKKVKIDR